MESCLGESWNDSHHWWSKFTLPRKKKQYRIVFFFHLNWPNNTRITQHIQIFLGTCVFLQKNGILHDLTVPTPTWMPATIRNAETEFLPFQALAGWGRVGFTKPPGFTWCCKPRRNLWDSKWLHPKISYWDVMIWRKGQQQKPTKANNNNNNNNNNNKPKCEACWKITFSSWTIWWTCQGRIHEPLYSTFLVGYPPFGTGKQFSLCSSYQTAAYPKIHIPYMDPMGNDLNTLSFPEKSLDNSPSISADVPWSAKSSSWSPRQLLPWLLDPYG